MSEENKVIQPQHKICEKNVDVPTVILEPPSQKGEKPTMTIQWFGQAEVRLPEESQFLFPVMADPNDIRWMGKPELFHTVFLGQVKDWSKPEVAQSIADEISDGNLEAWIAWLVSSYIGIQYSDRVGPASYAVKIVLLGDGNCGVITPKQYTNMKVLEEENQKVAVH